jgi:hypothetical protein
VRRLEGVLDRKPALPAGCADRYVNRYAAATTGEDHDLPLAGCAAATG